LYQWNTQISSAFQEVLHYVEVGLRNAMDAQLSSWATEPCLQHAFDGPVRRTRMHSELNELRRLRNRIAHHEPIHGWNLAGEHARLVDVADRISPRLSERIEAVSRVPAVLLERP